MRLAHDLGRIACAHSDCKRVILDYLRHDPSFEKNLLKCSHLNLCDYDQKDLCNLLLGLAHLEIHPSAEWMKGWFLQTQSYFSSFINVDFSQSLKALELLDIAPDVAWMKDWSFYCANIIENINVTSLAHLFSAAGSLGVQIDKLWIEKCLDRLLPALTILEPDDFLDLSGSFRIKEVRENKTFIDAWLSHACLLKQDKVQHVARSLLFLVYAKITIPNEWLR